MENENLKVIKFDSNIETDRAELKALYDNNKTELSYKGYSDKIVNFSIGFLEQNKEILIKNYPYGFTKRTNIKYWIETTKRGGRFCSQTLNPKTQKWNKPKKGTYSALKFLVIDETGAIKSISLDYNDSKDKLNLWLNLFKDYMTPQQKIEFSKITGYKKVMEKVEFKISETYYKHRETGEISTSINIFDLNKVDRCTKEGVLIDEKKEEQERKETDKLINRAICGESMKTHKEVF